MPKLKENTFKFTTFNERIDQIRDETFARRKQCDTLLESDSSDSYLADAIDKWSHLDRSEAFEQFFNDVIPLTLDLANVIYNKTEIVAFLNSFLNTTDEARVQSCESSVIAFLELLTALAKDLSSDFYVFFPAFFSRLCDILKVFAQNAGIIEHVFVCLTYLVRILQSQFIHNIADTIRVFKLMLIGSQKKPYIVEFACQSLAYIIRKLSQYDAFFESLVSQFMLTDEESNHINPCNIEIVGQIFFSPLVGVNQRLHSCHSRILPALFSLLVTNNTDTEISQQQQQQFTQRQDFILLSIKHAVDLCAQYCGYLRDHFEPLWNHFLPLLSTSGVYNCRCLTLLSFMLQLAEGKMICKSDLVSQFLLEHKDVYADANELSVVYVEVLIWFVINGIGELQGGLDFVHQLFNSSSLSLSNKLQLVSTCVQHNRALNVLDLYIFPSFSQFCADHVNTKKKLLSTDLELYHQILKVLFAYVNKKFPISSLFLSINDCNKDDLNTTNDIYKLNQHVLPDSRHLGLCAWRVLEFDNGVTLSENLLHTWTQALTVLSCVSEDLNTFTGLAPCLHHLCAKLQSFYNEKNVSLPLLICLRAFLRCACRFVCDINNKKRKKNKLQITKEFDEFLCRVFHSTLEQQNHTNNCKLMKQEEPGILISLQILDIALYGGFVDISNNSYDSVHKILTLYYPQHAIRWHSLRLLTICNNNHENVECLNILQQCLQCETLVPNIAHTARHIERYLGCLTFSKCVTSLKNLNSNGDVDVGFYVFQYLLGLLHAPYEPLLKPLMSCISSYLCLSTGEESDKFLSSYCDHLNYLSFNAEQCGADENNGNVRTEERMVIDDDEDGDMNDSVVTKSCDKLDVHRYRLILWQILQENAAQLVFAVSGKDYCLRKLCDIALQFIEVEFVNTNKKFKKTAVTTLITILKFFAECPKLPHFPEATRFYQHFIKLLSHRTADIQSAAFTCLLVYHKDEMNKVMCRFPQLSFEALLDDKRFKGHLLEWNFDNLSSQDQTITDAMLLHERKLLAPFVLRIIFGKLQTKKPALLNAVFSYLGNCIEEERSFFLSLVFASLTYSSDIDLMSNSLEEQGDDMIHLIMRVVNEVLPKVNKEFLGRLNAMTRLVGAIFKNMANKLLDSHLRALLRLILCLHAISLNIKSSDHNNLTSDINHDNSEVRVNDEVIQKSGSQILKGSVKQLRQTSGELVIKFFVLFNNTSLFTWKLQELLAVRHFAFLPYISNLNNESVDTPGLALQLYSLWSAEPRFHHLLESKCTDSDIITNNVNMGVMLLLSYGHDKPVIGTSVVTMTPMAQLLKLLSNVCIHVSVANMIMEVLWNLLQNHSTDQDEQTHSIGFQLVLPYMSEVVNFVCKKVECLKMKCNVLQCRELDLLSCVSSYITEIKLSFTILTSLITFLLQHRNLSEELEITVLTCIQGFADRCALQHNGLVDYKTLLLKQLKRILVMYSYCKHRATRTKLCKLLKSLSLSATKPINLQPVDDVVMSDDCTCGSQSNYIDDVMVKLAFHLNAWDSKRIDEADNTVRNKAFQTASNMLETTKLQSHTDFNIMLHTMIAHNAFYHLSHFTDTSLHLHAESYLKSLVIAVNHFQNNDLYHEFMDALIWPGLVSGIKRVRDVGKRAIYLGVLKECVKQFGNQNNDDVAIFRVKFVDLEVLRDEVNEDKCFYDNLMNHNVAKNGEALRRLSEVLKTRTFNNETLVSILLPIVSYHLTLTHTLGSSSSNRRSTAGYKNFKSAKATASGNNNSLTQIALNALRAIAEQLAWTPYKELLRLVMDELNKAGTSDRRKLMILCLITVLEAFHFQELKGTGELQIDDKEHKKCGDICAFMMQQVYPKLEHHIARRIDSEEQHKLAQKSKIIDQDVLEVSVALALVKLLLKMPVAVLHEKLRRIFYRVCEFLKSRDDKVRKKAGRTLVSMLQALGMQYFGFMLQELCLSMTRGYQRHVLMVTVHHLLREMEVDKQLKPGVITDDHVKKIVDLCFDDLFGYLADEKEVQGIISKIPEAKKTKAPAILHRLACYLSAHQLDWFLTRMKEQTLSLKSHSLLKKMELLFSKFERKDGLLMNAALNHDTLLSLVYELSNDCLRDLKQSENKTLDFYSTSSSSSMNNNAAVSNYKPHVRHDCLLLDPEPTRQSAIKRQVIKSNYHVIVSFGLHLLLSLLRNNLLSRDVTTDMQGLDKCIPILTQSLTSCHIKVLNNALRCLLIIFSYDTYLPSLRENMPVIAKQLFSLQSRHAQFGVNEQENKELSFTLFKCLASLVRDISYFKLSGEQLSLLLIMIEADVENDKRGATAFLLLKSLLSSRKLEQVINHSKTGSLGGGNMVENLACLKRIMDRIRDMVIVCREEHIRDQAKACLLLYFRECKMNLKGKEKLVDYLVKHLESGDVNCRESAAKMLADVFIGLRDFFYQQKGYCVALYYKMCYNITVEAHSATKLMFINLKSQLMTIMSPEARQDVSIVTLTLLQKQNNKEVYNVFESVIGLHMLTDLLPRRQDDETMADSNQFVEMVPWVKEYQDSVVKVLLSKINMAVQFELRKSEQVTSKIKNENSNKNDLENTSSYSMDAMTPLACTMLVRLMKDELISDTFIIPCWTCLESLLQHPLLDARKTVCEMFALMLQTISPPSGGVCDVTRHLYLSDKTDSVICKLKRITYGMFEQLKSAFIEQDWAALIVHNLVCVCHILQSLSLDNNYSDDVNSTSTPLTVVWILNRMNKESNFELNKMKGHKLRRVCALTLISELIRKVCKDSTDLQKEEYLVIIARVLLRESLQMQNSDKDVQEESLTSAFHNAMRRVKRCFGESALRSAMQVVEQHKKLRRNTQETANAMLAVTDIRAFVHRKKKGVMRKLTESLQDAPRTKRVKHL